LVAALEGEHAAIDPLLAAIDAAAADPDYGYQRFGDVIDELAAQLMRMLDDTITIRVSAAEAAGC
jgi:hypothetical protein